MDLRGVALGAVGRQADYRAANPAPDDDFTQNEATRVRVRGEDLEGTLACAD